jgi:hypothetical protein
MGSTRIFADDTRLPVLDPGRGRTKTGRLWGYAVDDRPWGGGTPPAVVYLYAEDRRGEHPASHLAGFRGVLQVDGYSGFKRLLAGRPPDEIRLAFCWAHCRRRFYDIHQSTGSPLAEEALRRIGELYAIEAEVRGRPAEERRRSGRNAASRSWRPCTPGSRSSWSGSRALHLAEAIRYALRHWPGLVLFLDDGRLELDTNTSSGRSGRSPWGARTACSPARTAGPATGRSWPAWWRPRSSTGSSPGVAHRRARAGGLGPDQGPRARAALALGLEGRASRG